MKSILVLLALIILTFSTKARSDDSIKNVDEDLSIERIDAETGLKLNQHNISDDKSRYSLLLNFNADLRSLTDIAAFEFSYAKKLDYAWWEFFISRASVTFSEVAEINSNDVNLSGTSASDLDINKSSILSLGTGLSYRTSLIQNFFSSDRFFETVSAHIAYNSFSESFTSLSYSGFGVKSDLGLHYRTNESFHIGTKLSYNISSVKRGLLDSENQNTSSSSRSLTLSWLSLGFDVSYYF